MTPISGPASGPTTGPVIVPATRPAPAARPKPSGPTVLFPNLTARSPSGGYVQDDIVYSEEETEGDDSSVEPKRLAPRNIAAPALKNASDPELSSPPTPKAGADNELRQSIPHSAPAQQAESHTLHRVKSLEPRPTSSTETFPVADSAPASTENLPPPKPSTKLAHHFPIQTAPIGTETQRVVAAAERVNARLDAEDPDFVAATPAESDIPSQTQTQTQTQSQTDYQDTTISGTKPTSTSTSTSSRPRGGAEKRVRASERWGWAPIEDDDDNSSGGGGAAKGKDSTSTTMLTKAQLELQGIDGSVADGDGEDGGGERGGDGSGSGNGNGNGNVTARSPVTSRYSARKKTRRRVDG